MDMPRPLSRRTVALVLVALALVVAASAFFCDCDDPAARCGGRRIYGRSSGGYTSLCVED